MTRYEQGFMNKCAEYGVDGKSLLKYAQQAAAAQPQTQPQKGGFMRNLAGFGKALAWTNPLTAPVMAGMAGANYLSRKIRGWAGRGSQPQPQQQPQPQPQPQAQRAVRQKPRPWADPNVYGTWSTAPKFDFKNADLSKLRGLAANKRLGWGSGPDRHRWLQV